LAGFFTLIFAISDKAFFAKSRGQREAVAGGRAYSTGPRGRQSTEKYIGALRGWDGSWRRGRKAMGKSTISQSAVAVVTSSGMEG